MATDQGCDGGRQRQTKGDYFGERVGVAFSVMDCRHATEQAAVCASDAMVSLTWMILLLNRFSFGVSTESVPKGVDILHLKIGVVKVFSYAGGATAGIYLAIYCY